MVGLNYLQTIVMCIFWENRKIYFISIDFHWLETLSRRLDALYKVQCVYAIDLSEKLYL